MKNLRVQIHSFDKEKEKEFQAQVCIGGQLAFSLIDLSPNSGPKLGGTSSSSSLNVQVSDLDGLLEAIAREDGEGVRELEILFSVARILKEGDNEKIEKLRKYLKTGK